MTARYDDVVVIYDGACPLCASFIKMARLRERAARVELVNARDDHPKVKWVVDQGYTLDEGMAVIADGTIHYGADAVNLMAELTDKRRPFDVINRLVFSSKKVSRALYPTLARARLLALRLKGRPKLGY